jgi:hypothetical protein
MSTGDIVWFNGPFPAGRFNDLRIFCHALKGYLDPGEMVADRGYLGNPQIYKADYPQNYAHKLTMGRARVRHESVNRNLKKWKSLKHNFVIEKLLKRTLIFPWLLVLE